MSKRRIKHEKLTPKKEESKSEVTAVSKGWNSMTNWLVVLVFVLPILFSRETLDPAITTRYIFLGSFVLLFLLFFYVRKKISFVITTPVKIVFALGSAFGLWSVVSTFSAINPSPAFYEISRHFLNLILLFAVFVTAQKEGSQLLKICKAIVLMSLIQSIVGIFQYYELGFTELPGAEPKPYGLMANRNVFGSAQAYLLPFIIFVLYKASKIWKLISIGSLCGIALSVFISQTRSSWLAAATVIIVSLILVILFSPINRKKWLISTAIAIPVIAGLIALVILNDIEGKFTESIKQRAGTLINVSTNISTTAEEGGNERLKMWRLTANLIKDNSISGVGPGNWKLKILPYDSAGLIWPDGKYIPTRPHNDYLQVASETGIPGFILYAGMWVLIVIVAIKIINRSQEEDQRILIIIMISGLACFAIDAMFSFPTERIEHSLYIYLIAGFILGNSLITKEKKLEPTFVNNLLITSILLITAFNIFLGYKKYTFEKHMNYAKAYENNKNYQEELTEVEAGKTSWVTIDPEGKPLEIRSMIAYTELKDYNNALAESKKALQYHPYSPMIYNNIGTIYTELKDYNSAIENYLKALRFAPKMDIALKNLAINYFNVGNFSSTIDALNKVEDNQEDSVILHQLLNEAKRRLLINAK